MRGLTESSNANKLKSIDKLPREVVTLADGTKLEFVHNRQRDVRQATWQRTQVATTPKGGERRAVVSDDQLTSLIHSELWQPHGGFRA